MTKGAEITTKPPDLFKRMNSYPQQVDVEMKRGMVESLIAIHKNIPAYAPKLPNQRYIRTGRLGMSMGVTEGGTPLGTPDIYTVQKIGTSEWLAEFGSRISYSEDVIGAGKQKPIFEGRWWTDEDAAKKATPDIVKVWTNVAVRLVTWLDGKGL